MSIGKLVVIEGVDATGKTTLAKGLADFYRGAYYKTPGNKTIQERHYFDQPHISVKERFEFYLHSCQEDLRIITQLQEDGKTVFCDRFLDSTIASHKILDPNLDISSAQIIVNSIHKIQILLTASSDSIQQRINDRSIITRFEKDVTFLKNMQSFLKDRTKNDYIIETSYNTANQTLNNAISFLDSHAT